MNNNVTNTHEVIVICRSNNESPSFYAAKVICTQKQYEEVDFVDMICESAELVGLTVPGFGEDGNIPIITDKDDTLGNALEYLVDWDIVPKLYLEKYLNEKNPMSCPEKWIEKSGVESEPSSNSNTDSEDSESEMASVSV